MVALLQSIGVLAIAAIGAWIAFQQMQMAAVKLQHDLYDRRYRVFEAARKLLAEVTASTRATDETMRAFLIGTGDAIFLFDDSITAYLEEMRLHAAKVTSIGIALETLPVGDERGRAAEVRAQHIMWLVEQATGLPAKFKPALQLDARKRRARA
ncbi:MAG TPA: hypothetical protein VGI95_17305 [Caulobacteraceae bacterium]|jgi:hypothetical protein